jgi:hypothetical protein
MRRVRMRRKGATLVLVTTIGVIVGILGMAMVQLGYHARVLAIRNVQRISSRCAADAGMAEAIFKMQKKLIDEGTWDGSNLPSASNVAPLDGDIPRFSYTITGSVGNYLITSTGTCGLPPMPRTVYSRLQVGSYWEGIGVKETVDIKLGTSFGIVGPGVPADMVIRSNSTEADAMKFKAFVTVPGDILCGPGGNPEVVIDLKATTTVLGEIYAAKEELIFPPVAPPGNMTPMGSLTAGATTISGGRFQYDVIDLPNNGILTITGPTVLYVTGKMTLGQSAEVIVAAGGSLELYLGTALEDKNSTGFSNLNGDDASTLKIYGLPTCTWIDLKAKSTLAAAVYAPEADIDLYNAGDFIGAITSNSFDMKNSGNFYFDTRLLDLDIDDPAAVFVVGRWWEN